MTDVNGHRSPSLDYAEEFGKKRTVNAHEVTKGGTLYRCSSQFVSISVRIFFVVPVLTNGNRPLSIRTHSMEYWMSLNGGGEWGKGPLARVGSVLLCYQYALSSGSDGVLDETSESTLALAKVRLDLSHAE